MRIIKMGNSMPQHGTCPYCGCEYEYDEKDFYMGYDLTQQYKYLICPCCGRQNNITYFYVPPTPYYNTPILETFYNKGGDSFSSIPRIECTQSEEAGYDYTDRNKE